MPERSEDAVIDTRATFALCACARRSSRRTLAASISVPFLVVNTSSLSCQASPPLAARPPAAPAASALRRCTERGAPASVETSASWSPPPRTDRRSSMYGVTGASRSQSGTTAPIMAYGQRCHHCTATPTTKFEAEVVPVWQALLGVSVWRTRPWCWRLAASLVVKRLGH